MNKKVAIALTAIAVVGLSYPAARLAIAQTKPKSSVCANSAEDRLQGRGYDALRRAPPDNVLHGPS